MVGFTVRECAKALRRAGERASSVVPYVPVRASRGKLTRAEPVAALYAQGRVRHVGMYADQEDQLTSWVPGEPSPDRLDALVWGLTALVIYGSDDVEVWGGSEEKSETSEHVREVAQRSGAWFPPGASRW